MAGVLAIVPAATAPEVRPEDDLISLPYIDLLSKQENEMVEKLLQEEAARGPKQPHDYLKELTPVPLLKFQGHTALQAEWARVRAGGAMEKLMFGNTMAPEPPQAQMNSVPAWRSSHENACAQLEHQHNWQLNIELAQKYGPRAWQAHNEGLTGAQKRLEKEVAETNKQIEAVNRMRSLSQTGAASQLSSLHSQWASQVAKNQAIEAANRALETRIMSLESPEVLQPALQQEVGDEEMSLSEAPLGMQIAIEERPPISGISAGAAALQVQPGS